MMFNSLLRWRSSPEAGQPTQMSTAALGVYQNFIKTDSSTSSFTTNTTMMITSPATTTPPCVGDTLRLFGRHSVLYQNERDQTTIHSVPESAWMDSILPYVDNESIFRFGGVCRSFRAIFNNEWQRRGEQNILYKQFQKQCPGHTPRLIVGTMLELQRFVCNREKKIGFNYGDVIDPAKTITKPQYIILYKSRHQQTDDDPAVRLHYFPGYHYFHDGDVEELRLPLSEDFVNRVRQKNIIPPNNINITPVFLIDVAVLVLDPAEGRVVGGTGVGFAYNDQEFGKIAIEDTTHDGETGEAIDERRKKGHVVFRIGRRRSVISKVLTNSMFTVSTILLFLLFEKCRR